MSYLQFVEVINDGDKDAYLLARDPTTMAPFATIHYSPRIDRWVVERRNGQFVMQADWTDLKAAKNYVSSLWLNQHNRPQDK